MGPHLLGSGYLLNYWAVGLMFFGVGPFLLPLDLV
jgi:hypothetical protein